MTPSERSLAVHRALSDLSRAAILEELREAGAPLDVAELAKRVGLHQNTVRSHLDVLLRANLLLAETARRDEPGRPRVLYRPNPAVVDDESSGFRLLAEILASHLSGASADPEGEATEAGRMWGHYLIERPAPFAKLTPKEALSRVAGMLSELGFSPEPVNEGGNHRILLHRCPFRDIALRHPEVTCSVHLGLMRGALAEMGAPVEATRLEPFVEPSLCVAHFRIRDEATTRA